MKNYKIYIGIDTGVQTGLCIWVKKTKGITVYTFMIHEAISIVRNHCVAYPGAVFIRVEDARLRKWIPYQKNPKAEAGRREGAGSAKRDAKIWEDFLTDIGADFEMVAPKNNKTKVTAAFFKKLTGYQGKTNEHERDAAMLVVGK